MLMGVIEFCHLNYNKHDGVVLKDVWCWLYTAVTRCYACLVLDVAKSDNGELFSNTF